jgi:ribosomal protein S6--L-glutamate ligase
MHIGILSARGGAYHPNNRMIQAAAPMSIEVSVIHPKTCISNIAEGKPGIEISSPRELPDVLLPRLGATIKEYALALVRHFELSGVRVVNGFGSILLARNKFMCLQTLAHHGIPVPRTFYVSNLKNLEKAVKGLGGYPVVAKTPSSRQGKGVILMESSLNAEFVMENLPNAFQGLLVQEFIHPDDRRDIRAFVAGGQVIGAMELRPRQGEFRANIHLKSMGKGIEIDTRIARLAVRSSRVLGLEISGVDLMISGSGSAKVIEVNYSPGFRGLEKATGLDIAALIIRYLEQEYGDAP